MKKKTTFKLPLTVAEKQKLRENKVNISEVLNFTVDELSVMLGVSYERARELYGLAEFQTIPSIGVKFAEDLVFLNLYSITELKDKDAARLLEAYELKKGYFTDLCVEDQFRLAVHYANTNDATKNWWHFTGERKKHRAENGYPSNRPKVAWYEHL